MKTRVISAFLSTAALLSLPALADCPSRSPAEWQQYLDGVAAQGLSGTNFSSVNNLMINCSGTFSQLGISACMKNLSGLARVRVKFAKRDMGFVKPNADYLADQPQEMMKLPPELANGLPEPDDKWKKIAADNGWPYFEYSSRTVPNPPNSSYKRLLFYVPGKTNDRWIQFTRSPNGNTKEQLIDFITVQKMDGDQTLTPARIHFRQYWRDQTGHNPQLRTESPDNCYSCHPGGIRQLSPEPGSLLPIKRVSGDDPSISDDKLPMARLAQFNKIMAGYGNLDWNKTLVPEDHGPPLGKVAGCVRCHDGGKGGPDSRGALNTTTFSDHVKHKVDVDLSMPPKKPGSFTRLREKLIHDGSLSGDDKDRWNEVKDSHSDYVELIYKTYPKELQAWLRETGCVAAAAAPPVAAPAVPVVPPTGPGAGGAQQ